LHNTRGIDFITYTRLLDVASGAYKRYFRLTNLVKYNLHMKHIALYASTHILLSQSLKLKLSSTAKVT